MSDKKSFEEFILEYTNAQLAQGGTATQRAIAQSRQRKREEELRAKQKQQDKLGSALAKRSTSTALDKAKQAGKLAKTSSALVKQVKKPSTLARTSSYKEPMAKQADEKQVSKSPYSYNRGVTTLPDNEARKKRNFKALRLLGRGAKMLRSGAKNVWDYSKQSGKLDNTGTSKDKDETGIETRNSMDKVN